MGVRVLSAIKTSTCRRAPTGLLQSTSFCPPSFRVGLCSLSSVRTQSCRSYFFVWRSGFLFCWAPPGVPSCLISYGYARAPPPNPTKIALQFARHPSASPCTEWVCVLLYPTTERRLIGPLSVCFAVGCHWVDPGIEYHRHGLFSSFQEGLFHSDWFVIGVGCFAQCACPWVALRVSVRLNALVSLACGHWMD